jgi:hypothetical protein
MHEDPRLPLGLGLARLPSNGGHGFCLRLTSTYLEEGKHRESDGRSGVTIETAKSTLADVRRRYERCGARRCRPPVVSIASGSLRDDPPEPASVLGGEPQPDTPWSPLHPASSCEDARAATPTAAPTHQQAHQVPDHPTRRSTHPPARSPQPPQALIRARRRTAAPRQPGVPVAWRRMSVQASCNGNNIKPR